MLDFILSTTCFFTDAGEDMQSTVRQLEDVDVSN